MNSSPRLINSVRAAVRVRHYSYRTEKAYVDWIRRFILFNAKRNPRGMGCEEMESLLNSLAARYLSASSQSQGLRVKPQSGREQKG